MPPADLVTILDYGMGNVGSIANMIRKIGGVATVESSVNALSQALKLILPGVGAFDEGMSRLHKNGLTEILKRKALTERVPILGICLGMQLLTRGSEEGSLPGLGWIDADTRMFRFDAAFGSLRVPHMGWNEVRVQRAHPVLGSGEEAWRFYFVHSYHVCCDHASDVLGLTDYGPPFVSAVGRDNILGVQFHPEKSHSFGMRLLRRFLEL